MFGCSINPLPVYLTLHSDKRALSKCTLWIPRSGLTLLIRKYSILLICYQYSSLWLHMQGNNIKVSRCLFRWLRLWTCKIILKFKINIICISFSIRPLRSRSSLQFIWKFRSWIRLIRRKLTSVWKKMACLEFRGSCIQQYQSAVTAELRNSAVRTLQTLNGFYQKVPECLEDVEAIVDMELDLQFECI